MKKLFTLCLGLFAALALQAQNEFPLQFADKDGNVIADGTTLNISEAEDDGFGDVLMPSGIFVKNNSNAEVQCAGTFTIQAMSNGAFQSCFPLSCMQAPSVGNYTTQSGALAAGALQNMATEWLPKREGSCTVTYTLVTYKQNPITKKWNKDQEGPTITLKFTYGTTGIKAGKTNKTISSVVYYNLTGKKIKQPVSGVYLAKTTYSDGTIKCVKTKK